MMKFGTLIFILLVTVQHAGAQWLTMDQFNVWENIVKYEYGLSPDSIIRQHGALTKAEMLRQNQHIVNGFESAVQSGVALLRYPRPVNLKYIEAYEKGGKLSDSERSKIDDQNEKVTQEKEDMWTPGRGLLHIFLCITTTIPNWRAIVILLSGKSREPFMSITSGRT